MKENHSIIIALCSNKKKQGFANVVPRGGRMRYIYSDVTCNLSLLFMEENV